MSTVISVENLSKQYRLGQVGTGTLAEDLTRLWYQLRGKEDPFLQIGETNDRTKKSDASTASRKFGALSRFSPFANRSSSADHVWSLKDINFDVKEGSVLGIIGRNGAGKSTLLKILARVTTPTTGQVKIKGRIASLLEVGTGFHPDLSGRENIYLNGAILGMRKQEIARKFDEIIEFSGCERYIDTPVKRYSSGMYVRLAFAVAAHLDPEILIVDEVLAVGDAEFQRKCLGKMKEVSTAGRTVIFVSHNMAAVEKLCDSGILMENGTLLFSGDVSSAIEHYLNRSAVGELPSNQLIQDENRSGRGRVRIRRVEIFNAMSVPTTSIKSCDPLILEFFCENLTGEKIEGVSLGYSISTSLGDPIVVQYSDYEDQLFSIPPGLTRISVRILSLPFAAGMYQIGARLVAQQVEEDWPKYSVATLIVDGGLHGGNANVAHSGRGILVLHSDWKLDDHNLQQ